MYFDRQASGHFGQLRTELQKQGTLIDPYDQMIAGYARNLGLNAVTNNERELEFSRELRTEDFV